MDILCPTDLTPAAHVALARATDIAARSGASITLLHVLGKQETRDGGAAIRARIDEGAQAPLRQVPVNELLLEGDPLPRIIAASEEGHALLVAGTHGVHGLRQAILGADMLRLVRQVKVPSFVVQEHTPKQAGMDRIVLPVAGHADISQLLGTVSWLAKLYGAEVLIYHLVRAGETPSDRLLDNKLRMLRRFSDDGVRHREVNEPSTVFSAGFAEQTIRYAEQVGAGCIAIMAKASDDYRWIADAEKERMLNNTPGIPVLCAN